MPDSESQDVRFARANEMSRFDQRAIPSPNERARGLEKEPSSRILEKEYLLSLTDCSNRRRRNIRSEYFLISVEGWNGLLGVFWNASAPCDCDSSLRAVQLGRHNFCGKAELKRARDSVVFKNCKMSCLDEQRIKLLELIWVEP